MQDSWRVTRRLTLHSGLRWEAQLGRTERYDRFNNFDFNVASPLAQQTGLPLKGGLVFVAAGPGRMGYRLVESGAAHRHGLQDHRKIVVRGGYGIYYPQTGGGTNQGFSTDHHLGFDRLAATASIRILRALLSNPFPNGITAPAGTSRGLADAGRRRVNAFSRDHPLGYVQNFSFDIQTS